MRIRVERSLREAFVNACRAQDQPALNVLRGFMRTFTGKQRMSQYNVIAGSRDRRR